MKLYHGTNVDFDFIDFNKTQKYKDFGQGFYLTDIRSQAEELAKKKVRIFGGTPIVQEYDFDESNFASPNINVLSFKSVCIEWAEFIYKNRRRTIPAFKHSYDIVIGPIADDGVAYLLGRYEEGSYTIEQLAKELEFKKLNRQFYFGTDKAIQLLKRIKE